MKAHAIWTSFIGVGFLVAMSGCAMGDEAGELAAASESIVLGCGFRQTSSLPFEGIASVTSPELRCAELSGGRYRCTSELYPGPRATWTTYANGADACRALRPDTGIEAARVAQDDADAQCRAARGVPVGATSSCASTACTLSGTRTCNASTPAAVTDVRLQIRSFFYAPKYSQEFAGSCIYSARAQTTLATTVQCSGGPAASPSPSFRR